MATIDAGTRPLRVERIHDAEKAEWDRFVGARPTGHLLQSWEWGTFKAGQGWDATRVGVRRRADGRLAAAGQVLFRRPVRGLPATVAYAPRGPVMPADEVSGPRVALLAGLHALCRKRGAVFLKIEPNAESTPEDRRALAAAGFREAQRIQPQRSILLDLQPDAPEEALLSAMKPKTRYNVRLATRRGVTVRLARDAADVQRFYDLMQVTGQRDAFALHSLDYYRDAWRVFGDGTRTDQPAVALLLAEHPEFPGGPVAGLMAFAFGGEAIYMYGASADAGREHMPTYLLQWEAMRWARGRGCRQYDFWGIPDHPEEEAPEAGANPNVRQGLWGVYRFKQGFGGREVQYLGAWDFVYRPLAYAVYLRLLAQRNAE